MFPHSFLFSLVLFRVDDHSTCCLVSSLNLGPSLVKSRPSSGNLAADGQCASFAGGHRLRISADLTASTTARSLFSPFGFQYIGLLTRTRLVQIHCERPSHDIPCNVRIFQIGLGCSQARYAASSNDLWTGT